VKGPDGRVTLWVEVGLPEAERLVKAARHAPRVLLLACGNGRPRWEQMHLPKLAAVRNLAVYGLDFPFVQQLAARLERSVDWSLTVSGATLYLTVAGETLEAPLAVLKAPAEG
jgi:uncharacterized protein YaeQ